METKYLNDVVVKYVKLTYPIKKYRSGRRFVKGIKVNDEMFKLKGETKNKLYYLMADDLRQVVGIPDEKLDIILLSYLKYF